ncbi:MAG: tetratricopeptide repeat protein [Proteobacteria bacterium]|nr:tetratricopeptide repeat protein [Pseudomonadota bacterium]MBI3497128.1 tetratricopeptide repeat protein [Pseudomonadota bacterium]
MAALGAVSLAVPAAAEAGQGLEPTLGLQLAQASSVSAATRAEYDRTFQAVLRDPGNLDLTFRFAELAVEVGDLEGAIGALERLLVFNPDLPRVRLELGVLYYRLGSHQAAKAYLEQALAAPNAPAEVRERVRPLIAEIDRSLTTSHFFGAVQLGTRYQTDANAATATGNVKLFGLDATLSSEFLKQHDSNGFIVGNLGYIYDLGNQAGDAIESNLRLVATRQFRLTSLDLGFLEADVGPRFHPFERMPGLSLRPYAVGGAVTLGEALYYKGGGGGLSLDTPLTRALAVNLDGEGRARWFHNTASRSTSTDKNGPETVGRLTARYALSPVAAVVAAFEFVRDASQADNERNNQYGVTVAYNRQFSAPFRLTRLPWSFSLNAGRVWREYAGPDSSVDPDVTRHDREWSVGGSLTAGLFGRWSATLQVQQQWVNSALVNFAYRNSAVSLALGYAF